MKDILIVDDEKEISFVLKEYFENFNIRADACLDDSFFDNEETYKIIIMDINLANKSGYDICRRIRENDKSQHIIFISAREREEDIIMGYSVGADDYIVKPFQMNILLMKVMNILNKGKEKSKKKFREYDIDEGGMRLVSEEKVIEMKNLEFKLFMYLYENRGKVVDKYEIINNVWGEGYYTENNLNVHIKRIRDKIGDERGAIIKTYWGKAYMLV